MMEKIIRPFYHDHPLILKENVSKEKSVDCYGCGYPIGYLEMAYVCMEHDCSSRNTRIILHKKCGELPSEIRHPKHHNHVIYLFDLHLFDFFLECNACGRDFKKVLCYVCFDCDIVFDITCEKLEERIELQHPSHPDHPLTLMRKPAFPFKCDGCGAEDVDMAYICSACEFWVHKKCALLPTILPVNHQYHHHHHHHPLSLAYSIPRKHDNQYLYKCDVCDGFLMKTSWVYYCDDCRYFVHIKCVGSTTNSDSNLTEDDEDVIQFPLNANDISNKLITPFVMREKGLDNIPTPTSNSFLSNYHDHPLSLSLSLVTQEESNDEEELIKICDVCVTPISSSSSSSPYYHCPTSACNYFIHSICSMLPNTLQYSSSPNLVQLYGDCQETPDKNHNFTLYKLEDKSGISYWRCNLCNLNTNGMGYKCEECGMKIDIKCASLPTTIRHSSHRRHHKPLVLNPIKGTVKDEKFMRNNCHACYNVLGTAAYCCGEDGCDFGLDFKCLQLPKSVKDSEWDNKHPLLLTFDAYLDHPSDFFCEFCEEEMHPQMWMYHCRECDVSLHPYCLDTAAGYYRNIKFGRRYELDGIHKNHSLTYTCITLKKRCDVCHDNNRVYTYSGFECADCYFVVCRRCGLNELRKT